MKDEASAHGLMGMIVDRGVPEILEKGRFLIQNHVHRHRIDAVVDQMFGGCVGNTGLDAHPSHINNHHFEDILIDKDAFMVVQVQK